MAALFPINEINTAVLTKKNLNLFLAVKPATFCVKLIALFTIQPRKYE
jgi:hypothetical protein